MRNELSNTEKVTRVTNLIMSYKSNHVLTFLKLALTNEAHQVDFV